MNILIINADSTPNFIWGIKRVCITLARQWTLQGMHVSFVCVKDSNKTYDSIAGIPQVHLPESVDILSSSNKRFLCQLIQDSGIDLIFNPFMDCKESTRLCVDVSKDCGVKLVNAWHFAPTHFIDVVDNSFFAQYKLGNPIKHYLLDFLLWIKWHLLKRNKVKQAWNRYFDECIKNSASIVFLSERFLPTVEQMVGYQSDKVIVINNPNSFDNVEFKSLKDKEKIVLWSGRFGYDMKRTDKMLYIWKQVLVSHKDWRLIVCGSGDTVYFRQLCSKFHIKNIEFSGFVNMEEYYAKASILCNTSVTEGWGMVITEAMQYSCVPMAFDSYASVHDIIEDGDNGYIIPAFDEKEYARKLDLLMSDKELRMKMASNGRESTKHFEPEMIAQQWIELFHSL